MEQTIEVAEVQNDVDQKSEIVELSSELLERVGGGIAGIFL